MKKILKERIKHWQDFRESLIAEAKEKESRNELTTEEKVQYEDDVIITDTLIYELNLILNYKNPF